MANESTTSSPTSKESFSLVLLSKCGPRPAQYWCLRLDNLSEESTQLPIDMCTTTSRPL
ncbi:hypothetical protein M413DRAFT_437779 [Hebeloma cylindrosporum]|uniref:Uncharacterized protein n=1 Tax=Hebeloma cylindrosporum TaxID=76867 RepID=A0A0C2Z5W3_HEBCY|nr:hypothetical protein M413DRAFT_437779 [Hebeloma cylindrosporum h7]